MLRQHLRLMVAALAATAGAQAAQAEAAAAPRADAPAAATKGRVLAAVGISQAVRETPDPASWNSLHRRHGAGSQAWRRPPASSAREAERALHASREVFTGMRRAKGRLAHVSNPKLETDEQHQKLGHAAAVIMGIVFGSVGLCFLGSICVIAKMKWVDLEAEMDTKKTIEKWRFERLDSL